ncbi:MULTISPECIES: PAS domain-containing sensor histidine kinase [unclassified Haloferax]|uniref:PAS domain-containing sensor histidine kinase n=1 Tax=unclassified Haloferax TaxID=2625095 RepID=UPI000E22DDD3|nr:MULTISPECIES: PAS domain-containing protein [unclassified Haloferax]MBC9987694.1 PAS domain S-box protein [Haloferax sp. AS1]RDZ33601.1 histidine kinase [Haloferax sp. Atlit-24N]RLM34125.1 PAS domain S-box protein [Haloferax sp. Atlit-109R]RLM40947.1 PAS domain S-box protein [Haloferax sp. Atlit-105R]
MFPPSAGGTSVGAILYVAADGVVSGPVVSTLRDAFERPVERAESAAAARSALAERTVSCLVAAADLPDGLDLDALVTAAGDARVGPPVVVYAAAGDEALAARAVSLGVDDYLVRDETDDSHAALVESVRGVLDRDADDRPAETRSYRVIVEAMEDGAFVLDEDCRVEYVNPRIEAITGRASETLRGERFESLVDAGLFPADEYERYRDAVSRVLSEGVTERLDVRFVDADGVSRLFELSLSPAGDGEAVTGVVGIPRDVTDREVATTQRGELLERMTDAFFALDTDWRFVYLNDRARDVFNEVREPELGERIWDLVPSPDSAELYEKYHEAMRTQESVTFETYSEPYDGWFEVRAYPSPSGLSVYFRDVTTRKRYLQALESTNQRLETVLQNLPVILSAFDAEGVFTMSEGAGLESLGREPGEVVGRSAFDLYDDTPAATDAIARGLSGEAVDTRIEYRGAVYDAWYRPVFDDGEVSKLLGVAIDVTNRARLEDGLRTLQAVTQDLILTESVEEVAALAVDIVPELVPDAAAAVWLADDRGALSPAASTAEQFDSETPIETAPGGFESDAVSRVDAADVDDRLLPPESDGKSVLRVPLGSHGLLVVSTDDDGAFLDVDEDLLELLGSTVTSALSGTVREQELRNREADLAAANERLDDFVSIVAHDLRNPLAVATGYLDLGMESGERAHLERAANAVDRMSELVEEVLDLARQRTPVVDAKPVDLARVVDHAWRFVDTGDATLVREELFVVEGDDGRLLRLFENLFRNAVEHGSTSRRDTPDDPADGDTPPDDPLAVRVGALDDRAGFYVADNGVGVPETRREQVFDHGYTTMPRGTGYGLAIVRDIADAHGWSVSLTESAEGGARFEFVTRSTDRTTTDSAGSD